MGRALLEYAGIHGWKSTRGALNHYGANHDEFYLDMTLWEAKTGGPRVIRGQCEHCGILVPEGGEICEDCGVNDGN